MGVQKYVIYRGFGIRFVARSIDSALFFLISYILGKLIILSPLSLVYGLIVQLSICTLIFAIYEIILTSKYGGTIGKLLMKIKVVDLNGNFISISDSIVRYFSKWLSGLTLGIGYLMIIWTEKKQGLHDKIANTYVIDNPKSNVGNKIKTIIMIVTLLLIFGIIVYFMTLVIMSGVAGVQTALKSINTKEPVKSVVSICKSKFPMYSDLCLYNFVSQKSADFPNLSSQLEVCSNIKSNRYNYECVNKVATTARNISLCSGTRSSYYSTYCKKLYNFTIMVSNFFHKEYDLKLNGNLNISKATTGLLVGNDCIEVKNSIFDKQDIACFTF